MRIREVKQIKKAQGKFTGGKRAFGYEVLNGFKVKRADEQKVIQRMLEQRAGGASFRAIETWLAQSENVRLSFMGVRDVLSKAKIEGVVISE